MSDPCSKETNDKVMERIRKEFVATPTVEELEAEIERLRGALEHCAVARLCTSCEEALAHLDSGGE
jgi:hypothetical protein